VDDTTRSPHAGRVGAHEGQTPRFIGLDPSGAKLYAANQRADTIVEFEVNEANGLLAATGRIVVTGTPVCIVWR